MCSENIKQISLYVDEVTNFISKIKFENRKVGQVGLIIGLKNAIGLYEEYSFTQNKSRSHRIIFWSHTSRYGSNNNPTCYEFQSGYKKLLVKMELKDKGLGNCIPLDQTNILTGSTIDKINKTTMSPL